MNMKLGVDGPRQQVQRATETTKILARAAMEIISEQGMKGITFGAISARAGVSKSLVLYHFGSKAKLVHYLLDKAFERRLEIYADSRNSGMTGLDSIFSSWDSVMSYHTDPVAQRSHSILLVDGPLEQDLEIRERIADYNQSVVELLAKGFREEFTKRGCTVPKTSPELLAVMYLGAARGIMLQYLLGGYDFENNDAIKILRDMLRQFVENAVED